MDDDSIKIIVRQIAQTLGVPEDVFWINNDNQQMGVAENAAADELELLTQFRRIKNPTLRRLCLEFVAHTADTNDQVYK